MANDFTLPVRRAILTGVKADAPLTAEVPASSIHPQSPLVEPTWPFIKYGASSGIAIRASCVDGNELAGALHGFSRGRHDGTGALVETAEDHAARIGALMAKAIDRRVFTLDDGRQVKVRWTGSRLLPDGAEPDAYHTIQTFTARALA